VLWLRTRFRDLLRSFTVLGLGGIEGSATGSRGVICGGAGLADLGFLEHYDVSMYEYLYLSVRDLSAVARHHQPPPTARPYPMPYTIHHTPYAL